MSPVPTCHLLPLTSYHLLTSHSLLQSRVQLQPRLEILPQEHAHIYPTQGITIQHDTAHAERHAHGPAVAWVTTADDDLSGIEEPIGVAEKHDIQSLLPEHTGRHASRTRPAASVENLHLHAMIGGRYRGGMTHDRFRPGRLKQHRARAGTDQDAGSDQCEADVVAVRLFQNRNVGSGMGHPERTR